MPGTAVVPNNSQTTHIRILCTEGLIRFIGLWEIISEVQLDAQTKDSPIWAWNVTGVYTASSAYKMLCEGGVKFHSFGAIWKC